MADCSIYETDRVDALRAELRFDPQRLRRLRTAFFKHAADYDAALAELPDAVRDDFAGRVRGAELTLDRRLDSAVDGASRLVFKTAAGFAVESVILRAGTGRVALCVSSQVGCAAACDFCATGRMGVAHDLAAGEILDQVAQANRLLRDEGRRVRNVVFMGMGEPMHNERTVVEALACLTDDRLFHHPPSRVLVSSVGVPDAMLRVAERFPGVNYALSLHAADQETRARIVPLARRYPLDELRRTVAELNRLQGDRREVMVEYLMLAGVNDAPADIDRLVAWIDGLRVHVNLIPYNRVDEAPHLEGSSRGVIEAAAERVRAAGAPTTIRYSMGADIAAACGQLVKHENRAVARALSATAAGRSAG